MVGAAFCYPHGMSDSEIYVKGDRVRRVTTPAERVAAEFDGFKRKSSAPQGAEVESAKPTPEFDNRGYLDEPDGGDADGDF